MPRLTISLFGPFQVFLDGVLVSGFTSKKAQALLAYLAVEARPHPREELAGLLWPDYPEASARANLRSVLTNVRRVIDDHHAAPPYLTITRQTIYFNPASNCHLDVALFDRLAAPDPFDPQMIPELEAAVAHVQDAFLAGFSLSDSPAFEEWIVLKREYLGRQVGKALRYLTNHYAAEKAYAQALAHARHWVKLDPWQEEGHQQVMRLLACSGRRSEALAHYASGRRILIEEFGVEPGDEMTNLYGQIRDGALNNALSGEANVDNRGVDNSAAGQHTINCPLTPLIGREQEVTELTTLLADPNVRLLTIVGPGGIGKTHLALEAAAAQQPRFQHGVALVSLAPLDSVAGIVSAVAEAVRFSFYDNVPPEQQILDYLREKQMLLVMDNFEHLLDGAGLVTEMLETAPGLKILATSRIRLQIHGEQLYPLSGLAYPDEGEQLETLFAQVCQHHFGALTLFEQQARRLHPDFALTHDTIEDVARICRLVEGMPLGIVLASGWIEMLTPNEIADEIARSFAFLQDEQQGLPARHQNLQAVFAHTWSLLTEREQSILQQSSLFRGGFTQEAVRVTLDATLPELLTLASKFLLHRAPNGRYTIHELLRQFVAQKLSQTPEDESVAQRRHSAFFSLYLQQREDDLKGARQQQVLSELEAEGENIRVAWRWAVEHGQIEQLDQAANCLGYFYLWRARYQEGEATYRTAAAPLKELMSGEAVRILAKVWLWQGIFNRHLGHSELAGQLAQQSLRQLDEPTLVDQEIRPEQAAVWLEIGQQTANMTHARGKYEQCLALYQALDDSWGIAQALHLLGQQLLDQNEHYDVGTQSLAESLRIRQSLGDQRGIAETLQVLGFSATLRGQGETSERLLRQSLAIYRKLDDKAAIADNLMLLAHDLGDNHGQFAEAHTLVEEASNILQSLGNPRLISAAQVNLSWAYQHLGRYEQARIQAELSLDLSKEMNDLGLISFALWRQGDVALVTGAFTEAETMLSESIAIHQEISFHARLKDVRLCLGYALLRLGRVAQAQQCLVDSIQASLVHRQFLTQMWVLPLAALIAVTREEPELAVEYYALASRYPYVANSCWFEDVAGRHITTAAMSLLPDIVAAAQKRGQARDLWATVEELLEAPSVYEETNQYRQRIEV